MALLQLFKCLNPDCGLTSTLSVIVDPHKLALSSACIHCHALHQVVRNPAGTGEGAYSVTGLVVSDQGGDGSP
ncbi:MAG TPA: hypothetical protein VH105_18940 [Burkholderiales bacterium]|jgi:hypothetical protein|nr:hypothetical protein [Burkholderiales bacterium]